jgi:hypothetical protein
MVDELEETLKLSVVATDKAASKARKGLEDFNHSEALKNFILRMEHPVPKEPLTPQLPPMAPATLPAAEAIPVAVSEAVSVAVSEAVSTTSSPPPSAQVEDVLTPIPSRRVKA